MSLSTPSEQMVLEAAAGIVDAFSATDTERYFAAFAPEASFAFHTEATRLQNRAAYETLWASWLAGGWQVTACLSTNPQVQVFPGGAVFCHDVDTSITVDGQAASYRERETIVFRLEAPESLIALHEHLSPTPSGTDHEKATP